MQFYALPLVCLAALLAGPSAVCCQNPEQIHLSYGYNASEMVVTWSTSAASSSVVNYGISQFDVSRKQTGQSWRFTEGNPNGLQYMHRVVLKGLTPGATYWYTVQSDSNKSDLFHFTAMQRGQSWPAQFIVYGDMGRHGGAQSLPALILEAATGSYAAFLHVGDFAYDFDSSGGINGDEFMNRIQQVAAYVPYMTCPGNHEAAFNFSHYVNRFSMPIDSSPHWYSWDVSNVHFISYSTEVYFDGWGVEEQYSWLEQDLTHATAKENRTLRPWIIAYGHRPMYCSTRDGDDCTTPKSKVRAGLEALFYKYGVDVILEAHEHCYERLWPVYNETVTAESYTNPKAPVHLISGTAGCNEVLGECFDPILGPRGPWSAFRSWWPGRHGYGRLSVANGTHLQWEQVIASGMKVEDSIWLVQQNHGSFLGRP